MTASPKEAALRPALPWRFFRWERWLVLGLAVYLLSLLGSISDGGIQSSGLARFDHPVRPVVTVLRGDGLILPRDGVPDRVPFDGAGGDPVGSLMAVPATQAPSKVFAHVAWAVTPGPVVLAVAIPGSRLPTGPPV